MLHVFSDSLRSLTTLVESLLIWLGHVNAGEADTWSSLVVSLAIVGGSLGTFVGWFRSVTAYYKTGQAGYRRVNCDEGDEMDVFGSAQTESLTSPLTSPTLPLSSPTSAGELTVEETLL